MSSISEFDAWKKELLFTGRIIQDGDDSVGPDERHERFMRYIELVEAIDGTEGRDAIAALLQSVQMEDDYGAYQTTYHAFAKFTDKDFIEVFVAELPNLIARQPEWAGDFLVGLANGQDTKWEYQIEMFNEAVTKAPEAVRQPIIAYIRENEKHGWFTHRIGVLCPSLP